MHFFLKLIFITIISVIFINEVRPEFNEWRITGGVQSYKGEFPYHVALVKRDQFLCSGSLIAQQWVVTAAHCLINTDKSLQDPQYRDRDSFTVRIGEYNLLERGSEKFDVNITKV